MNKQNEIKIEVQETIYPLDAVIATSYKFLEDYYIFLDKPNKGIIEINIRIKDNINFSSKEKIKGDFLNELLYSRARINSAKRNNKIREFIVGRALFSVAEEDEIQKEFNEDDPLDIKMPWDDK